MYSCSIDINRQTKTIRSEKRRCRYIFSVTCLKKKIFVTHLGESWIHHLCLGLNIFFFTKYDKECTSGTQ